MKYSNLEEGDWFVLKRDLEDISADIYMKILTGEAVRLSTGSVHKISEHEAVVALDH